MMVRFLYISNRSIIYIVDNYVTKLEYLSGGSYENHHTCRGGTALFLFRETGSRRLRGEGGDFKFVSPGPFLTSIIKH